MLWPLPHYLEWNIGAIPSEKDGDSQRLLVAKYAGNILQWLATTVKILQLCAHLVKRYLLKRHSG